MKSLSPALPLNFLGLKIEWQLFVSIFEEWVQIKNTLWNYSTFTFFKKLKLKLSLISTIFYPRCLSAHRYFKVEFLRYCFAACAFCYFFFKLLYLSPGGSYLSRNQHSFTHSPAAINLTPTFCRIFLLANHSLLRTSVQLQ